MLRSLFLLRVLLQVRKSLCAASDLAASISGGLSATGSSASGMPSAVFAMTIASRSSVLASPANSLEAPCAASPGRYARSIPASLARESASEPMLRTWSTTTSAPGYCAQSPSMAFSLLGMGLLARSSPSRVTTHAQCADFPTSSPMTILGLVGGAMVVSSNRQADRKPSPRHPHYLAVAPGPGSFLSVVRSGERLRWQHPRPSSGQGQTAIRRRPIGGPSGLARIVGNAPNTRHRSSSVAYLGL